MNFANQDSQDSQDSALNSESIMEQSMEMLYDMVISPMENHLDVDDLKTLGLIGITFQIMAEKAHAYEKIVGESHTEQTPQDFSRN